MQPHACGDCARMLRQCAAAAPPTAATPKPPKPPKPAPDVGAELVLVAFQEFDLPSADVLAAQGFVFKFSDPQYASLGAVIPPGAWPPGDTR